MNTQHKQKVMNTNKQISSYALDIMEENPHLHIIAFTDSQLLAVSPKSKKAHFFYEVNEDISFHFNMLCEVRRADQIWFAQILKDLHYHLEPMETETDYYEIIVEK